MHAEHPTGWRALVIDDEDDVRSALRELLELEGALVEEADSVASALPLLRAGDFDVVVADYRLPDGDGLELLAWAQARSPRATRVLVSAFQDFAMMHGAINEARVHLFAAKPWDPAELRASVRQLVQEQRGVEERVRALVHGGEAAAPRPRAGRAPGWPPS